MDVVMDVAVLLLIGYHMKNNVLELGLDDIY